jgi:hypothetical protein
VCWWLSIDSEGYSHRGRLGIGVGLVELDVDFWTGSDIFLSDGAETRKMRTGQAPADGSRQMSKWM